MQEQLQQELKNNHKDFMSHAWGAIQKNRAPFSVSLYTYRVKNCEINVE